MPIPLKISPRIIPSIASLYNDTNRIFMEYIDNSLDGAEEFFDKDSNSYTKKISITLDIYQKDAKNIEIIISDSCTWIRNMLKVIQSIWNSDKKAQPWTNWQFWYWIYSFMACCNYLKIISKEEELPQAKSIIIDRNKFNTDNQEDVVFPDFKNESIFPYQSWTIIKLSNFDKSMAKQIDLEEIKSEIEKHFELLLHRKNLEIKLTNKSSNLINKDKEYTCTPFNYDILEWEIYDENIRDFDYIKGKKYPEKLQLTTEKPIHIYLKITKWKVINKLPVFISKWRRIAEIKDIKAFHSKHKSDIWWHPNITGYIDLQDFIEPTIARNDFKNTDKSKALFSEIIKLEELILLFIHEKDKESENKHYQVLEDKLNQALSKLAKLDSMNYRTEYWTWSNTNLQDGGSWQSFENWFWRKDRWEWEGKSDEWDKIWENEWDGIWPSWNKWNDISWWEEEWDFASNKENENPFEDSDFKWWEKKKSWFNIEIVDVDLLEDESWKKLRSQLIWTKLRIFKKHPDFESRLDKNEFWRWRKWWLKVTQRLITYLAWEITVHYKDTFHNKSWKMAPEYNKKLFEDLVEFIYKFEDILKDVVWMNLSDFSDN